MATLLYLIGIELIGSWFHIARVVGFDDYFKYYILIQGALQLTAILLFLYLIRNRALQSLFKEVHFKWYVFALILGLSFVFVQTPLKWFYNVLFGTEYHIAYRFDGFPKFKNVNLISYVLLIPISEELFFRAYIQQNLQIKTHKILAVIVSAILFALIHSPYLNLILESSKQDWHLVYLTVFGGLISGILYYKSKSIGPSIIFHIFWNIMVILV